MKIKLLNKVRKSYKIIYFKRIDNPNHILYNNEFPLYALYSIYTDSYIYCSQNYDSVYKSLVNVIHTRYYYTKTRIQDNSKQIWYNQSETI